MMDFSGSPTYEQARSQLIVQVVDAKRNQEMLSRVPHTRMEDLALFYCIQSEDGRSAALVTNELMKAFGISKEQLHEDALANAAVLRPATFRNIAEVLAGFLDAPPDVMAEMASPLYVVSNTESVLGASAIFYPGMMEQCSKELNGDFFILPSSVHEVLLLSDDGSMTAEELQLLVSAVNENEVADDEVLSDSVYHYDSGERKFELAERFEARQEEKTLNSQERSSILKELKNKQRNTEILPKVSSSRAVSELEL